MIAEWTFLAWVVIIIILVIFYRRDQIWDSMMFTSLAPRYIEAIRKYNTFYQRLPVESRRRFERKVKEFIHYKEFIPRNLTEVTDEMKALIASAAVQLTFGLPDVTLLHFDKILVYPNNYYSVINRQYHKGEVNPRMGAIVVSWHAFVEGFADPNDGVNLGLHEMAHALKLENIIQNGEEHFLDLEEYTKWIEQAGIEIKKIREGKESIFRQYASVDEDEFFAVCMELYFEQPHKLFEYNSELYKILSNLLHQDTIRLYDKPQA